MQGGGSGLVVDRDGNATIETGQIVGEGEVDGSLSHDDSDDVRDARIIGLHMDSCPECGEPVPVRPKHVV